VISPKCVEGAETQPYGLRTCEMAHRQQLFMDPLARLASAGLDWLPFFREDPRDLRIRSFRFNFLLTLGRHAEEGYSMENMPEAYDVWLDHVRDALRSMNMHIEDWQGIWPFDFTAEYEMGIDPDAAAMKANRFWWCEQNKSINRDCHNMPGCWLPQGHQGECQPNYERGDYVKVEFPDETTGTGEWMWMRVDHRDDTERMVFGSLDNEPVNDYAGRIELGSQLAVRYAQIREHKKPSEFQP